MAVIHISEAEAAQDFAGLLDRVRAGAEVVIDSDSQMSVVLRPAVLPRRTFAEFLAMLPPVDEGFARDVEEGIESMNQPLDTSAWD